MTLAVMGAFAVSAAEPVTASWSFKVSQTNIKSGSPMVMTTTSSSDEGTWTMTWTGASGQVVNDKSNGPRFGSSNAPLKTATLKLTDSPIPGNATITGVELEIKGNAGSSACTWKVNVSEETVSMSGNTATALKWENLNVTNPGEITFELVSVTAGIQFGGVKITYTEGEGGSTGTDPDPGTDPEPEPGTKGDIVAVYGETTIADSDDITVEEGTVFTFSAENATKISVSTLIGEDSATADAATLTWTPKVTKQDGVTVTATFSDATTKTLEFYVTVTAKAVVDPVKPSAAAWVKVTYTDQITAGSRYVIVNEDAKKAIGTATNGNNRKVGDITVNADGTITLGTDVMTFMLEKSTSGLAWKTENYASTQGYLSGASGNNYVKIATTISDACYTSATIDNDGNAVITFLHCTKTSSGKTSNYVIRYNPNTNNGSPLFASYVTSTGSLPQLYKWVEAEAEVVAPAATIVLKDDNNQTFNAEDGINLTGENITIHFQTEDGITVYHNYTLASADVKKAPTEYTPKDGYTAYDGNGLTLTGAGSLSFYTVDADGNESDVQTITVTGEGTTAITEITADGAAAQLYDLQGRRVTAPRHGAIYISAGRKIRL